MLIFAICILLNALIGVVFKLFNRFELDTLTAIVVNYFTCVIVGSLVLGQLAVPMDLFSKSWLPHAIALSAMFPTIFFLYSKAVNTAGVGVSTIFQKISLIAPAIVAIVIFSEPLSMLKALGILLAILSLFLLQYTKGSSLKTEGLKYLILVFLGSCFIDTYLYLLEAYQIAPNGDIEFVSTLFFFAGLFGLSYLLLSSFKTKRKPRSKDILGGILLGIPNFFSIYLILYLLGKGWNGSTVFPVNNVGVLLLSVIFGILFFKEKLNTNKVLGIALAILSIYLITFH